MKDAQTISSPMGVDKGAGFDSLDAKSATQYFAAIQTERVEETRKRLTTYYNAVRYFSMALPANLKYRGQFLSFESTSSAHGQAGIKLLRELHTAIYSIHLMTQLAFLMTLKYHLFKLGANDSVSGHNHRGGSSTARHLSRSQKDVDEYFEAANSILAITNRCNDQFYRYVNPFLVNTIWLAAAVQLLKKELFSADETERDLVTSNFEVLRMSYDMFVEFWRSDDTAKKNLAALQTQLKTFQEKSHSDGNAKQVSEASQPHKEPEPYFPTRPNGNANSNQGWAAQSVGGQYVQPPGQPSTTSEPVMYNMGDQRWQPPAAASAPVQPFDEQNFSFLDSNFLDAFNLPTDFDLGTGYNTFDDVFSGSVF